MIYNFTQTYQHKRDWAMPELVKHRNADRSRPKELEPAYAHLIIIQLHFLFKHVGNLLRRYFLFFQKKLGEYYSAHFTLEHLKNIIFVHLPFQANQKFIQLNFLHMKEIYLYLYERLICICVSSHPCRVPGQLSFNHWLLQPWNHTCALSRVSLCPAL